jgi:hypothetical protein
MLNERSLHICLKSNYYEDNVSSMASISLRLAPRSILTLRQLNEVYAALADRFHEAEVSTQCNLLAH